MVKAGPTPAFVSAQVSGADRARVTAYVRKGQSAGHLAGGCFGGCAEERRSQWRASPIRPQHERCSVTSRNDRRSGAVPLNRNL